MDIKRNIFNELHSDFSDKSTSILIGARQVGKTFLLRELEKDFKKEGLKTSFFDLEQPENLAKFNLEPSKLIKLISESGEIVFIDEFHYIENASQIFKAIYDGLKKVKIYASGSSSIEIHKHLKESLVGRKFIYKLYPCSFNEIKQVKEKNTLEYYCKFGGMPRLIHYDDDQKKIAILEDILQSYILKDIKSLIREKNITAFNNLLYLLAQYQGSIISTSSMANETRMTSATIESYLQIMKETYTCFPLHSFSGNFANELKKSKKYYLYDLGIRNILLKNFSTLNDRPDSGEIVESFVFGELHKKLTPETEIRFWRLKGGEEVDFIWIKNQRPFPIEVKSTIKLGDIPKGLKDFLNKYPKTPKAFVVNKETVGESKYNQTTLIYKRWEDTSKIPDEV